MFGTIKPCKKCLLPRQRAAYRQHYCGLCFALHNNFGRYARLFLNYDLTNDYLLSGSSRQDGQVQTGFCPFSLWPRRVSYVTYPGLSDYYAQLNFVLVYYKLLDDVLDDGSLIAKLLTDKMEPQLQALEGPLHREAALLRQYLGKLAEIEKERELLPVLSVAALFGALLRDMVKPPFVIPSDEYAFCEINYWTGVWIYTMDAILDCLTDGLRKRYNPILAGLEGLPLDILRSRKQELLDILRACRENILLLLDMYPTYENGDLLRSLFSGELPKIVCIYLEVEKDELIAQSKIAAPGAVQ